MSQDVNDRRSGPWVLSAGEVGPHAFDFVISTALDLRVTRIRGEIETVLSYPDDYAVTVASYPGTGSVTLAVAPNAGDLLIVEGLRPLASPTSDEVSTRLDPEKLNTKEDTAIRDRQEIRRDIERGVRVPRNESGVRIPGLEPRRDRVAGYDQDGNPSVGPRMSDLLAFLDGAAPGGGGGGDGAPFAANLEGLRALTGADASAVIVFGRQAVGDWGEPRVARWDGGDMSALVIADEVTAGEGDGGLYVAPASDKTGASGAWVFDTSANVVDVRWWGATAAGIAAIEASTAQFVDLAGRTIVTTLQAVSLTKSYFNGVLKARTPSGTESRAIPQAPIHDRELIRRRSKTPTLQWEGKNILWLGTSIPFAGDRTHGYPEQFAQRLKASVTNLSFAASHATWDPARDPYNDHTTTRALAMTEADRLWGVAQYGASSYYSDSYSTVTQPSSQTAEYRIFEPFDDAAYDVVVLDHNHNDRRIANPGTLSPEQRAVVAITKGSDTVIELDDIGGFQVGDGIALGDDTGIRRLDWLAARVDAIDGNEITVKVDSSGYSGSFDAATATRLDRSTVYGAWEFLIHFIRWAASANSRLQPLIILCGAPSEYTGNKKDPGIYSISQLIADVAEKHDLAFFDIAHALGVQARDHLVFFEDSVHPETLQSQEALANHWVEWALGGAVRHPTDHDFLARGSADLAHVHQREALYSRWLGGFGTPGFIEAGATLDHQETFGGDLSGYIVSGNAPTIVNAPWGAGKALRMNIDVSSNSGQSYIRKGGLTLDQGGVTVEFDLYLDEVVGVVTQEEGGRGVTIFRTFKAGTGQHVTCEVLFIHDHARVQLTVYDTANGIVKPPVSVANRLERRRRHRVKIEHIKSTAGYQGAVILWLDGVQIGQATPVNDRNMPYPDIIDIGSSYTSLPRDLSMWIGNVSVYDVLAADYSQRHTGVITVDGIDLSVVNGYIVSAGSGTADVTPETIAFTTSSDTAGVATSSTATISGVNRTLTLVLSEELEAENFISAYQLNGGDWIEFIGSAAIEVVATDTLALRMSNLSTSPVAGRIRVTNQSDGSAILDEWDETVTAQPGIIPAEINVTTASTAVGEALSNTVTISGITQAINLTLRELLNTATLTTEYRKNGGSWTAVGAATTVSVAAGDTLQFKVTHSEESAVASTIRIENASAGDALMDEWSVSVPSTIDVTPDALAWAKDASTEALLSGGTIRSVFTTSQTITGITTPITLRVVRTGDVPSTAKVYVNDVELSGNFVTGQKDFAVSAGDTVKFLFHNASGSTINTGWTVSNLTDGGALVHSGSLTLAAPVDETPAAMSWEKDASTEAVLSGGTVRSVFTTSQTVTDIDGTITLRVERTGDAPSTAKVYVNGAELTGNFVTFPKDFTVSAGDTVKFLFHNTSAGAINVGWSVTNQTTGGVLIDAGSLTLAAP